MKRGREPPRLVFTQWVKLPKLGSGCVNPIGKPSPVSWATKQMNLPNWSARFPPKGCQCACILHLKGDAWNLQRKQILTNQKSNQEAVESRIYSFWQNDVPQTSFRRQKYWFIFIQKQKSQGGVCVRGNWRVRCWLWNSLFLFDGVCYPQILNSIKAGCTQHLCTIISVHVFTCQV